MVVKYLNSQIPLSCYHERKKRCKEDDREVYRLAKARPKSKTKQAWIENVIRERLRALREPEKADHQQTLRPDRSGRNLHRRQGPQHARCEAGARYHWHWRQGQDRSHGYSGAQEQGRY